MTEPAAQLTLTERLLDRLSGLLSGQIAWTDLALLVVLAVAAISLMSLGTPVRRKTSDRFRSRLEQYRIIHADDPNRAKTEAERARRNVEIALREFEKLQKASKAKTLRFRLKRAGLHVTETVFILICLGITAAVAGVTVMLGLRLVMVVASALLIGIVLPYLVLGFLAEKRTSRLAREMPDTLDAIVRSIRSGLPLVDSLKLIAAEGAADVRPEFSRIVNDLTIGLNMDEAVGRFADRVASQEAHFFATVIAIQSRSGGNLSEILTNLSKMLREQQKFSLKLRAMSSEARTSAWIIGSLPVGVIAVVRVMSPDYMDPLFDTLKGNLILGGSVTWMLIGALVMRGMIRIEL